METHHKEAILPMHTCHTFRCKRHEAQISSRIWQADLIKLGDKVPEGMVVPIPEGKPAGALGTVLERSRQISLKQYEKPTFTKQAWREALHYFRDMPLLTKQQEAVFAGEFFLDYLLCKPALAIILFALLVTSRSRNFCQHCPTDFIWKILA